MAATIAAEAAATLRKVAQKGKQEEMHLFAKIPGEESLVGRIKSWGEKIKKLLVPQYGVLVLCFVCLFRWLS